jgi:predicted small secreted protein
MKKLFLLASCLCLFGTGMMGCQNTAEGAKEDTQKNGAAVQNATENAADKTKMATDTAADKTKDAMGNAGDALNLKPKLALAYTNDATLKDTKIDTDVKNGTVYLKGTVKTNDQKKHAGELTQKTLTEAGSTDKVVNQLTVTTH